MDDYTLPESLKRQQTLVSEKAYTIMGNFLESVPDIKDRNQLAGYIAETINGRDYQQNNKLLAEALKRKAGQIRSNDAELSDLLLNLPAVLSIVPNKKAQKKVKRR